MARRTPSKKSYSKTRECQNANAKNFLSPSYIDGLVGRDDEYKQLFDIIKNGLETNVSMTLYISGPAGTGKTLTANTVINDLKKKLKFEFITLNCMSFQNASDFYEKFLSNFERKSKRQCTSINSQIQFSNEVKNAILKSKNMIILLLDEIDQLQTKNCKILNSIFKLPILFSDKVILIGIANALDFTAKMFWLKNENKANFHEVRFLPYKKEQIVQIIENRLKLTNHERVVIDRNAIEYCARKIASCSGDIRKALDVCRRSIELIENNQDNCGKKNFNPLQPRENIEKDDPLIENRQVNIKLMMSVLNKVYGNAVDKIESETKTFLPTDQQVILCVFLIFFRTKSLREIKLPEFRELLLKICKKNGITLEGKSESDILNMCQYLSDYGYVTVVKREGASSLHSGSPFKRNLSRKLSTITLTLLIDPQEAEQLISSFHKSIISDAYSYMC